MEYNVYLCDPVGGIQVAAFMFKNEAEWYVRESLNGKRPVDPRDTDNGNNHHWFEIYHGEPVSEGGTELQDPIFTSIKVYND